MADEDKPGAGGDSGSSGDGGAGMSKEERIKALIRVVCICKGITLGQIMRGIEGCETVADVNRKTGTGSGGCRGERCAPRIKVILEKLAASKR